MDEQRIWAPWRIDYIQSDEKTETTEILPHRWRDAAQEDCFLCLAAGDYANTAAANRQNYVVARNEHCVVLLNRFPYNNGHLLIAPLRHVAHLSDLVAVEHLAAMAALERFTSLLGRLIAAEGFNIGLNLGRLAGAGVPGHLHWHLVPRWLGDNNFMPTVAGTRVISQSLEALWETLSQATADEDTDGTADEDTDGT